MIRLRHETLPAGLNAIVWRRPDGDVDVIVSTALSAGAQRSAVRTGLRSMQPAQRRGAPLVVPALITLALGGAWLRAIGRLLRLHPAATIAAAATTAAAAAAIAVAPHLHSPPAGRNPPGAALAPPRSAPARGTPTPSAPSQPLPSAMPVPTRTSTGAAASVATSQASPATSSATQPPTGTRTPSDSGGGICLEVLGLRVCV